jgi:hypothetical protein
MSDRHFDQPMGFRHPCQPHQRARRLRIVNLAKLGLSGVRNKVLQPPNFRGNGALNLVKVYSTV